MGASPGYDFGAFQVRVTEDVIFIRPEGPLHLELAHAITQLAQQVRDRHDHYFILVDLRTAGTIDPEARRVLVKFGAGSPPLAIASYGASIVARGFNALLFAALNLLGAKRQNWMQFSSKEEAQAWLENERQRLVRQAK